MSESEIFGQTAGIVAAQFSIGKADVTPELGPEHIDAWDSLSHVALTSALETAFNVNFEIEEIMEMENVGAIVRLVSRKLSSAGGHSYSSDIAGLRHEE